MNRASIVLASLVTVAAASAYAPPAHAQPEPAEPALSTVDVKPPAGWTLDRELTGRQARTLRALPHLGGPFRAAAAYYLSTPPGAALVVSELIAEPPPADPVAAARAELASVKSVVEAAEGTLVSWRFQGGDPALPEARLEWTSTSFGTTSITRALVLRTAGSLVVVTADCVLGGDDAGLRAACEQALATLAPVKSLARVEVGLGATDPAAETATTNATNAGTSAGAGTDTAAGSGSGTGTGASPSASAPSMREGGPEIPTTIMVKPPASKPDRRPLMLLAGIAVLALVYLWNRRQKARLDEAEARERRREERRSTGAAPATAPGDDEADEEEKAEEDAAARGRDPDELAREAEREARDTDEPPVRDEDEDEEPAPDEVAREAEREARDPGKPGGGKEGA